MSDDKPYEYVFWLFWDLCEACVTKCDSADLSVRIYCCGFGESAIAKLSAGMPFWLFWESLTLAKPFLGETVRGILLYILPMPNPLCQTSIKLRFDPFYLI
jgi:hypothetical protein